MKNRKQISLLIPITLILFLVVGGLWMRGTAAPSDAFVETPMPTGEAGRITALQKALAAENLSPDAERSLREKLEMAERMRAQQEAGARVHSTKVPLPEMEQALAAPAAASTPQPIPDVIFEGSEGLVRPGEATIINGFEGQRNGKIVQVLAGALADDTAKGLLYVIEVEIAQPGRSMQVYSPEQPTGALRITAVEGERVVLSTESGEELIFDLITKSFQ